MTTEKQPWNPPYEIVEVPSDKVKLAFPENYFSVTIVGGRFQFSISTDLAGLPAVITRMEKLLEFAELGPMPPARHDDLLAQGIEAATAAETVEQGSVHESPVRDSECAQTPKGSQ